MGARGKGGALEHAGLWGKLGDLGVIEEGLDCAVSTTGGGTLGMLVCETLSGGQAVLAYLKEQK